MERRMSRLISQAATSTAIAMPTLIQSSVSCICKSSMVRVNYSARPPACA